MNKSEKEPKFGLISAINGSLIKIKGLEDDIQLHNMVQVVDHNIIGEIIQIYSDHVIAQCFENTDQLKLKDKVIDLKEPISMELAPGLLSKIFDGIQRPLEEIYSKLNNDGFLERGVKIPSLSRTKKWHFIPLKKEGDNVEGGDILGAVQETPLIKHMIMVPPNVFGKIANIAKEGDYTIIDEIYTIEGSNGKEKYTMLQKWAINSNRPYKKRIRPHEPLITGMRVIDLLFPLTKGGTVAVPGGFGTGKTVIQQNLAKWSDADVIIYCGVGERGNEIADVLSEFKKIIDPKSGRPLLERIVILANTSNMPVSAREASIFAGVTIGEYYRDMGYNIAVLADSTSRWAEALREISGLLEEMPAEEGYPAYLPSKLSSFYERAGSVTTLGNSASDKERLGSLSIIGSVSPPSGDFSEPVTATTKRFVQAFWALDASLAYSKHYPAINWLNSYSNYPDYISDWWKEKDNEWEEIPDFDWNKCRIQVDEILSHEDELKNITQLIGKENLPEEQQLILFMGKLIRNSFLIQSAFDDIDCFTDFNKLLFQIKLILLLYSEGKELLKLGFIMEDIEKLNVINDIMRISKSIPNDNYKDILNIKDKMLKEIRSLKTMFGESRGRFI